MNPIVATPGSGPTPPRDPAGKKPPADTRPQWARNVAQDGGEHQLPPAASPAQNPSKNQPQAQHEPIQQPSPETLGDELNVESIMSRFGGPRGPECRVFQVTPEGPGPMLFRFEPDAYPDQVSLAQKISRDHGEGEYDIRLFNAKGQPVAGGARRIYVSGPVTKVEAVAAPAPAPAPQDHFMFTFMQQQMAASQAQTLELIRAMGARQTSPDINNTLVTALLNQNKPQKDGLTEAMLPLLIQKMMEDPLEKQARFLEFQKAVTADVVPQDRTLEKAMEGFTQFAEMQRLEKEYEIKKLELMQGGKVIRRSEIKPAPTTQATTGEPAPAAPAQDPQDPADAAQAGGLMEALEQGIPALLNMARRDIEPDTAALALLSGMPQGAEMIVAQAAKSGGLIDMLVSKFPEAEKHRGWLEKVRLFVVEVFEESGPQAEPKA